MKTMFNLPKMTLKEMNKTEIKLIMRRKIKNTDKKCPRIKHLYAAGSFVVNTS